MNRESVCYQYAVVIKVVIGRLLKVVQARIRDVESLRRSRRFKIYLRSDNDM